VEIGVVIGSIVMMPEEELEFPCRIWTTGDV
jgi:hypothetical protein